MSTDPFSSFADTSIAPGTHWKILTPSDTVDLDTIPKGILIVAGGDVRMVGMNAPTGATGVSFPAVPVYSFLPLRPRRILATGTTATIIGIY